MNRQDRIQLNDMLIPGYPDEFETKAILSSFGIQVPRSIRLLPEEKLDLEAVTFPAVVKVCSSRILHKTDQGGVVLGIESGKIAETIDVFRKKFPNIPILVEEQIHFRGPELIVGALVDPNFGLAVMVGMGGILTELYKDVSFRLAPLTVKEAGRMIRELTIAPVFFGYRGLNCNPDRLAQVITSAADLAHRIGKSFSHLDINPLVFSDKGWIALDAKLMLGRNQKNQDQTPGKNNSVN